MTRPPPLLAAIVASAIAGSAVAQNTNEPVIGSNAGKSDWERSQDQHNWKEGQLRLPPYPKDDGLIEFKVSVDHRFRFFIDAASLSLDPDGVVRYTLIARSPAGFANVSYEGIRCSTKSYKIYALGHEGKWSVSESQWREIQPRAVQRWHNELSWQYFCPNRGSILSREEGLDALRKGGHPGRAAQTGF